MLKFFRKYQQYFFIIITIVIIISFSFFGTYSALDDRPSASGGNETAFKALNGDEISKREVELFTLFLSSDSEDKKNYGGVWGPNFLNDGVVKKDFLESGLAKQIALHYSNELKEEYTQRHYKEKNDKLYSHPQAQFISTEMAWSYFAPEMNKHYRTLKLAKDPLTADAFNARANLYLNEKKIPAATLKQILNYQQQQYSWVAPDPELNRRDLALFGYHNLEDWFGPSFMRLISEIIINGAIEAETRGYRVSRDEALASLVNNAAASYQENVKSPHLGVTSSSQYLRQQLMQMGIDESQAVTLWRKVLLFRRLFHDAGSSVFVAPQPFEAFAASATASVSGQLYRMPEALRFADGSDSLQKFKAYLDAVAPQHGALQLPQTFLTAEEVKKNHPDLVEKRYLVRIAEADIRTIGRRIPMKEVWAWEVEDANWKKLQAEYPLLGAAQADDADKRLKALDHLNNATRNQVDEQARNAIVAAHPEWITEALDSAQEQKKVINIVLEGGKPPLFGVGNRKELIELLDKAPIGSLTKEDALYEYTDNGSRYYRIEVLDRSPEFEILTYEEADKQQILDEKLKKTLKSHYEKIRQQHPALYQNSDKSWKPYAEVQDQVSESYVSDVFNAIGDDYVKAMTSPATEKQQPVSTAVSLRFFNQMRQNKELLKSNPDNADLLANQSEDSGAEMEKLPQRPPLSDQWKLVKERFGLSRRTGHRVVDGEQALKMPEESWSTIATPPNGDLHFYYVEAKANDEERREIAERTELAQRLIGYDAEQALMQQLLRSIDDKGAVNLQFMQRKTPR